MAMNPEKGNHIGHHKLLTTDQTMLLLHILERRGRPSALHTVLCLLDPVAAFQVHLWHHLSAQCIGGFSAC